MLNKTYIYKIIIYPLLLCFIQMILTPALLMAQAIECPYDKSNPTIENARSSFISADYDCAEHELLDYLQIDKLTDELKADAHILLATVHYLNLRDDIDKKTKVIEQFKAAFKSNPDWRGKLEIDSSEFIELMNEARGEKTLKKSKPWYAKWWAIGLGVGVVAAVVVAASSGGDDDEPIDNTLPGFPDPPDSGK